MAASDSTKQLEQILLDLGNWGKFQLFYYLCLGFVVVFSVFNMNYIFVARDIRYRCFIEQCDSETAPVYKADFLLSNVPFKDGLPEKCLRYDLFSADNESVLEIIQSCWSHNLTETASTAVCSDKFVFERPETTIVHDFRILCNENLWKLTLVGSVNVAGELVSQAYSGFLSDRFGRKTIMCGNLLLSCLSGLLKSLSSSYYMFLAFEFMDTALGGAMYGAAFIIGMELVAAKDRNLGNTVISCVYALGQIMFGVVAWLSPSWRILVRILYIPGLLAIPLWFWLPESLRWLISKNRTREALSILEYIVRLNGKEISLEEKLQFCHSNIAEATSSDSTDENEYNESFLDVLRHPILLIRTVHCSLTWICCTFVFYGLTIHSVDISENIYLSFIFGAVAETPGYVIYYYANERWGRRKLMSSTLILGGAFCLAVGLLPESWLKLVTFFCGKCCLTIAYTVLYVFTTELFPTSSRHAMFSICSMFGRIGSIVAPQIPLLVRVWKPFPLFLFSFMSTLFGVLALFFPETSLLPLPHTIEEALRVRKETRTCKDFEKRELSTE